MSPGLVSLSCACICDAQWDQFRLICAFTLLKLLSYLLHKIEAESISVILTELAQQMWCLIIWQTLKSKIGQICCLRDQFTTLLHRWSLA